MPPRILILADDLSGAADCAVGCQRAGMLAKVCLELRDLDVGADALALDLDTRALPSPQAWALNQAVGGLVGGRRLYRKIDSTLRGHVGLEIAATLDMAGPDSACLVCPAYPVTGRTVTGGCVYVDGQPLVETEIWRRGGHGPDHLETLLAEAGLRAAALPLAAVRGGALGAEIAAARRAGARAIVCDAETDADLAAIAAASLPMPGMTWAGSGGMAIALARALSPGGQPEAARLTRRPGPILVAVGSASSVSHRQLAVLARDPRARLLLIPPRVLLEGPDGPDWRPASRALVASVGRPGQDVVAAAIDPADRTRPADGPALATGLGALLGRQIGRFGALVATGGETARAILRTAGATVLAVRGELEPGVVLSTVEGLPVVTKAGAFGDADSLVRAAAALRALPLAEAAGLGASVRP